MLLAFQFYFTPPVVVEILPDEKLDAVPDQSLKWNFAPLQLLVDAEKLPEVQLSIKKYPGR